MSSAFYFVLFSLVLCIYAVPTKPRTCGFKSCPVPKEGMINVHIVPHTHDDVGWLKTVDQYYYGSKTDIQRAGVQYILDSVVEALLKDPKRRFIYVESEFFFQWWDEQTPELQDKVKMLVEEGRLEFAGGAWSMNDEATVHYQSVIDQFSVGLKRLTETFGECGRPRVGWQIDPFGHSREMASIFAQVGYDGQFFARLDWMDKDERLENKTAEMIWHGSPENLGSSSDLFTGVLFNHYSAPPGFCFDTLCSDEPIIDSKDPTIRNVDRRVKTFTDYVENLSKFYRTNNLMVPFGDDFNYQQANMNYKNMDKLIKYVNELQSKTGSKINVFYSTPSCYLKSLHDSMITWPEKDNDFFPYSTDPHSYWTGFYTSRPTVKRFERDGNHFLQVCKQLSVLANLTSEKHTENLKQLKEAMGILQHHDAVVGTEKQAVSDDYERILDKAIIACEENTEDALKKLSFPLKIDNFESCLHLNISECGIIEDKAEFVISLYNPLSKPVTQIVRIPVHEGTYEVRNYNWQLIKSQTVPIPSTITKLPFRNSVAVNELVFVAEVQKLDYFFVSKAASDEPVVEPTEPKDNKIVVENSQVHLEFDASGHLSLVKANGVEVPVKQDILYYNAAQGNNAIFANRSSGAYIFRPNGTLHSLGDKVEINIVDGPIVKEVQQKFNDWVSQVIRIYENKSYVEFEWLVGPIPINDNVGKEVVSRFTSNIQSNGFFYTDSNGRDMLKRERFHREYFTANYTEKVSSNYYPVTTNIALEDSKVRMAILNDRSQGGSSLDDGALELMVHRRLLHDDAFGVGEALNETDYRRGLIARGKHYMIVGPNNKESIIEERRLQLELHLPCWKFFSTRFESISGLATEPNQLMKVLSKLPEDVNILTLEPWKEGEILLRLENILEKSEGENIVVNLQDICEELQFNEIRETTLDGTMWLSDLKRLKFTEDNGVIDNTVQRSSYTPFFATSASSEQDFNITLTPMIIRTFIIKVENPLNVF